MKQIISGLLVLGLVFCTAASGKTKSAETDTNNYFQQFYVEENAAPVPSKDEEANGYILFVRNFMKRVYPNSIPAKDELKSSVQTITAPGEISRPLTFGIYPLKDLKGIKVTASDLKSSAGGVINSSNIDIRAVKYLSVRVGIEYMNNFMVLPKTLEKVSEIDIEKDRTREYWLTVKVPAEAKAGAYKGTISVNTPGTRPSLVDVSVEVLPFAVTSPAKMQYFTLMVFDFQSFFECKSEAEIEKSKNFAKVMKIYEDQKERGLNSISIECGPGYKEDSSGNPFLGDLEAALIVSKKLGFTKPVVYYFGAILKTARASNSGPFTQYDRVKSPALAKKIAEYYQKRCKDKGYPEIVFMMVDEPNYSGDSDGVRLKIAKELHIALHKIPGVKTFQTTEPASTEPILDVTDWFCGRVSDKDLAYIKAKGKKYGEYPFVFGSESIMFPRFVFGFLPWARGDDFVAPWQSPVTDFGKPTDFMRKAKDLNVKRKENILGEDGKVVPTVQWDSVRVGISDAKYIEKLETLIKEARETKNAEAVKTAEEAEKMLKQLREEIIQIISDKKKWSFEDFKTAEPKACGKWDEAYIEATLKKVIDYSVKLFQLLKK